MLYKYFELPNKQVVRAIKLVAEKGTNCYDANWWLCSDGETREESALNGLKRFNHATSSYEIDGRTYFIPCHYS